MMNTNKEVVVNPDTHQKGGALPSLGAASGSRKPCESCDGAGVVSEEIKFGNGMLETIKCPQCDGRLPYDVCRCHDDDCALSGKCLRYLTRLAAAGRTPHSSTLKGSCSSGLTCGYFIPENAKHTDPETDDHE